MDSSIKETSEITKKPVTPKDAIKKARAKNLRIFVSPKTYEVIENIVSKLRDKYPGLEINKSLFSDWLFQDYFEGLSNKTENLLFQKFYSEEKFLEKALAEIKRRVSMGETYTFDDFQKEFSRKPKVSRARRKEKSPELKKETDPKNKL